MSVALKVQSLTKSYGVIAALSDLSFDVRPGEIVGLLGPNGAGKTTAIECILGLRQADQGAISINGVDALAEPRRVRASIGAVLQSTELQDKVTGREALRLFASFYRRPADTDGLLERLGLTHRADAAYGTLSGGEKQRLALALALVNDPSVLVLDEPTAGLDAASRAELHAIVRERRAAGCAVLLSTHQLDEAHRLCDRLAIVDRGRLVALAPPDELIARSGASARIVVRTARAPDESALRALPGVRQVTLAGDRGVLATEDVNRTLIALAELVARGGDEFRELEIQRPTLEEAFLALTGRAWSQATEAA